ncbi:hypothetical protein O6H91_09G052900 [Diphasiastrum complanatum]|uniref:Uncharacterized protein n=2 Tax=Diphasiastrum complanatum TaxID=34168 RepID=A0ACC2CPH7_DIPCM|nr:hypothetical protein O6H91_09G052900 [Diphasiastrum complanatum]KAJ7543801.1 hypothetical protein O6H91_09G052900 [Diphasiastrum complanatum]
MFAMATNARNGVSKRNELIRFMISFISGTLMGIFIGISLGKLGLSSKFIFGSLYIGPRETPLQFLRPRVPYGTESLPPDIIVTQTDYYLRRLWGKPEEDLPFKPKYLLTITVGYDQRETVDKEVSKFSSDWMIVLFHYDGQTDGWDQYNWSQRAIHISVRKQSKWWFAKRFLHPDVVEPFEYIFIWDEDLDVQHFNAEEYIKLAKKHRLEISQPGLDPDRGYTWQMTKRRGDVEVHKETEERPGWCREGPRKPPCAGFVEIMAPVFSRRAWRCVWHMIQNDLVHGWGLDFSMQHCVEPAHEKIGVVDAQWIIHKGVPSLGQQGQAVDGRQPWEGVRERCRSEWHTFAERMKQALEKAEKSNPH